MSTPFDPKNAPPRHQIGSGYENPATPVPPGEALPYRPEPEPIELPSTSRLVLAFLAAAVVALLGAVLWAVISNATNANIGFLASLIGVAAGFTVLLVARGPVGTFERVLVGIFAGVSVLVGFYLSYADEFRTFLGKEGVSVGYLDSDVISTFVHHFGREVGFRPVDWLFVGFAAVAGYRISGSRRV